MEKVASSIFTQKIGYYLARAAKGESFLITSYGRPYAVIGPPPAELEESQEPLPRK